MTTAEILDTKEIATRENDGLLVSLSYNKITNQAFLEIFDGKTDFLVTNLEVPTKDAYNAYMHPFPYLALRNIDYPLPNRCSLDN